MFTWPVSGNYSLILILHCNGLPYTWKIFENILVTSLHVVISAPVHAYNRCWFFGDRFGARSFEQYFQARKCADYQGYVKANYDTSGFFSNFTSDNPSIIARLSNLMGMAMNCTFSEKLLPLPRLFVLVPDDDIIKLIADTDKECKGMTRALNRLLNHIMIEYDRGIATFKELLLQNVGKLDSHTFSGYNCYLINPVPYG